MMSDSRRWLDERFRDRPDSGTAGDEDLSAALARWQAARLTEIVAWAASRSPWYGRRLAGGLARSVVGRLEALAVKGGAAKVGAALGELPFTFTADLAADSDAFQAVGHDEVEGLVSVPTSGTGGAAKRIRSTAGDLEETVAFFEYGMRFLVKPGHDRVALAMSPARPGNVGDLLGRALARWGIPFLAHGFVPAEGETEWLRELAGWEPTCLVGVPAQVLALSRHEDAPLLAHALRTVLLSGDVAEGGLVAELERNFPKTRVFRHYGLTETGLGGAVECGHRDWPHLRDDLWVEIVDPERETPLPPGTPGEITVTPLTRRGMPLLRYRTGDEGLILPEPCGCGSILPRLATFGRMVDRLVLPGGQVLRPSDFEAPLMALPFVRNFELTWHEGPPAGLAVLLLPAANALADAARLAGEALRRWLGNGGGELALAVGVSTASASPEERRALGGKRRLKRAAGSCPADFFHC